MRVMRNTEHNALPSVAIAIFGALAHIAHELETLEHFIRRAESQSSLDARIRFRYDWLRQDLARMRLGILGHIDAPRAEYRTSPPLAAN